MEPKISDHFQRRGPSAVRTAQIEFAKRKDNVKAINVGIGNVSLPMHDSMKKRMLALDALESPFRNGVDRYTASVGEEECQKAFLNVISASGFSTDGLSTQITDGGSQGMELVLLGCTGKIDGDDKSLLVIDPAYTNYAAFAERTQRRVSSVQRTLQEDGTWTLPDFQEIENVIQKENVSSLLVIPYDNPTGQLFSHDQMVELGKLCAKYNLWMISDESYRELYYSEDDPVSIWRLDENSVPGITGRRLSIDSTSKVWNACGLRCGAIVTDNPEFHEKSVYEYTANLCANAIGQYIFGALAHESKESLQEWFANQRAYYKPLITSLTDELKKLVHKIIISKPQASIYSVVDVRNVADESFRSKEFVKWCASEGSVDLGGEKFTLLTAPMSGFYSSKEGEKNPGDTQMRIAYVETPENLKLVPMLMKGLLEKYVG